MSDELRKCYCGGAEYKCLMQLGKGGDDDLFQCTKCGFIATYVHRQSRSETLDELLEQLRVGFLWYDGKKGWAWADGMLEDCTVCILKATPREAVMAALKELEGKSDEVS